MRGFGRIPLIVYSELELKLELLHLYSSPPSSSSASSPSFDSRPGDPHISLTIAHDLLDPARTILDDPIRALSSVASRFLFSIRCSDPLVDSFEALKEICSIAEQKQNIWSCRN
uniref:Uncharacterized protein n=1 Tax=Ananas comosus var. bracteatus TaxID=296719 RepID=A0A6V7PF16_ANACO|nr:unnamed protein product [Ananas comosus var. bracteatus]